MTPLLLVANPHEFADALFATGVQKFIAQPFHFQRGKFIAATREPALTLIAQKLGCAKQSVKTEYLNHYRHAFQILKRKLPQIGEGKDGFSPPF